MGDENVTPDVDLVTPFLIEAALPIRRQLDERLGSAMSDDDDMALASALALALIAGFRQGIAAIQFGAIEHGISLTYDLRDGLEDEADIWAQAHGDRNDGSGDE